MAQNFTFTKTYTSEPATRVDSFLRGQISDISSTVFNGGDSAAGIPETLASVTARENYTPIEIITSGIKVGDETLHYGFTRNAISGNLELKLQDGTVLVTINSVGDILATGGVGAYNTVAGSGGSPVGSLNDLSDVTIASPANGQALLYDATSGQWENQAIVTANNYVDSIDFNTGSGLLTLGRSGLTGLTQNLDGRYALSSSLNNVAYTNVDNNFSVGQTINGDLTLDGDMRLASGEALRYGNDRFFLFNGTTFIGDVDNAGGDVYIRRQGLNVLYFDSSGTTIKTDTTIEGDLTVSSAIAAINLSETDVTGKWRMRAISEDYRIQYASDGVNYSALFDMDSTDLVLDVNTTINGALSVEDNTWHTSNDGIERLYFATNNDTFIKSAVDIVLRTGNNNVDRYIFSDTLFTSTVGATIGGSTTINGDLAVSNTGSVRATISSGSGSSQTILFENGVIGNFVIGCVAGDYFRVYSYGTASDLFRIERDGSGTTISTDTTINGDLIVSKVKPVVELRSQENKTWTVGETISSIDFYSSDSSGGGASVKSQIRSVAENTTGAQVGLVFATKNTTDGLIDKMTLSAVGDLGVVGGGTFGGNTTINGDLTVSGAIASFYLNETDRTEQWRMRAISGDFRIQQAVDGVNYSVVVDINSTTALINRDVDVTGTITATGGVGGYSTSDRRYKTNLEEIASPLERISRLNGYTFNWKKDVYNHKKGERDVGLVAQEVEQEFPELVRTNSDDIKQVDYAKMTAVLLEAVKELKEELEELKRCQ